MKISGAGSLSGPGAGALLVYHPDAQNIADWEFLDELTPLDLRLGTVGARFETPSGFFL